MQSFKVKLNLNKNQKQQVDNYIFESIDIFNTSLEILLSQDTLVPEFSINMLYKTSSLPAWISQNMCARAHKAAERYKFWDKKGKRLGRPRFKTEKIKGSSFSYSAHKTNQPVKQFGNKISLNIPGIGKVRGTGDSRTIEGTIKQVSIKCDTCGDYWACIITNNIKKVSYPAATNKILGIDLGLKHTINASNIEGSFVVQPERKKFLDDKNLLSLKNASNKDRKALPFVHRKIARRRQDYNWKLATKIVKTSEYIFVGNVSPKWLISGRLARCASDIAIGNLKCKISYLAESAGRYFEEINEAYTSKTCSNCELIKEGLKLSNRVFDCISCGFTLDRDLNAARNIAKKGWQNSLNNTLKDSNLLDSIKISQVSSQVL